MSDRIGTMGVATDPVELGTPVTQAVFIDSRVPERASLIAGATPGSRVFLLDAERDGLGQMAERIAEAELDGLDAIAVVAHGAPGAVTLGDEALTREGLSARAGYLATLGAALAPKGAIALYSCRTGAGDEGRAFLADLSRHAGGAPVAGASREVGATAAGRNWTLDVTSAAGRTPLASPFTAAAMQDYAGTLATGTDGQLIINTPYNSSNQGEQYLNSDSTTETGFAASDATFGTAIDPVLGLVFETEPSATPGPTIDVGYLAPGAAAPTPNAQYTAYYNANLASQVNSGDTAPGYGLAIDTVNHIIYQSYNGASTSDNGFLQIPYSVDASGKVTFGNISFLENSTGNVAPSYAQYPTYYNGYLYFLDYDYSNQGSSSESGVYRIATTGTNHTPQLIVNSSQYGGASTDIAYTTLDRADNRLYFTTYKGTSVGGASNPQIYVLNNASAASQGNNLTALSYASGVTAPTLHYIASIAYDDAGSALYVADQEYNGAASSTPYAGSQLYKLQLNAAGIVTSVIRIQDYSSADPKDPPARTLTFTSLPTLTNVSGTSSQATQGGSAVTLLSGAPTITDIDAGGYVRDATVSIASSTSSTAVSGDTLGILVGTTFTTFTATPTAYTFNGHTYNFSFSNGVLTIANLPGSGSTNGIPNENTAANYQDILSRVAYKDSSTTSGNRTATFKVDNGAIGSPSGSTNAATSTVQVYVPPPVVTAGGGTVPTYTEQGTAAAVDTGVTVTDPAGNNITGATVTISTGTYLAGDTLAVTTSGAITVASNTGGVLSLTGTASASTYQSVLRSVTYSSTSQNPDNYGTDKTRSIAFQVTDPNASSSATTDTVNVAAVNNPPTLAGTDAKTFTQGANGTTGAAVSVDDKLTVADPDSKTLASATVKITHFVSGDVLAFTNTSSSTYGNISGSYDNNGTLTLTSASASATLAQFQSALDAVTFSSTSTNPTNYGASTSRTVTFTASDGSSTNATSTPLSTTISITATDQAPALSGVPSTVTATSDGTKTTLAPSAATSDPDNLNLASATITETNAVAGDVLAATTTNTNIMASLSAISNGTETLTLSGTDTLAHYNQVLDSVTFAATQPGTQTRSLSWLVNDGMRSSAVQTEAITVCYCTGTRILTARGEVAVEDLCVGDLAVTASGEHRPVKWIGHRGYIGRFANCNPGVLPICFKAGSLADGVPARDLWVSPKHAMFLDGVLIPAEHLVNGSTITKAERVEAVEYWHVELDSHDVLLAEGATAESFVDDNGRCIFHNAHTFHEMYPDARRAEAVYCAPRVESGFVLDAVRRRLATRAGLPVAAGPGYGALRGFVERVEDGVVHGWAQHKLRPGSPVCLDVLVDGAVVGLALAETFRGDLLAADIGEGRHGFSFALPAEVRGTVTVRRSADGAVLPELAGAAEVRAEPMAA